MGVLTFGARPAYYDGNKQKTNFYYRFYDYDLEWVIRDKQVVVINLYKTP